VERDVPEAEGGHHRQGPVEPRDPRVPHTSTSTMIQWKTTV
jgi:hypothetical protein